MEFRAHGNVKPLGLRFLIYGRKGCIGGLLGGICDAQGIPFAYGSGRLEDRESLRADIAAVQPSHVFNAAGATGRPNVDWCEFNKIETLRSNVIGALNIADVCWEQGLPLIFYSSGCIFDYDSDHPVGSGICFTEIDASNYNGSFFSKTKGMNFTLEEQAKFLVAPRCNNELDSIKLKQEFPKILPIKESVIKYVF